jgi:pyridoxal phosphate enzyme (YggS family)
MAINKENYIRISEELKAHQATLVAVSKTKPAEALQELYDLGQRDFGENYVQELTGKQPQLPADIRWHFIGHLQSNKVKYIAPFVHLIHSIDSLKLLQEVNKQAQKNNRIINVLLQVHIALEETKFGFDEQELLQTDWEQVLKELPNISLQGLMGMASFTEDQTLVRNEFKNLKRIFDHFAQRHSSATNFYILSMGMSGDYQLALEEGSNMVRIGSLIFGSR